MSVEQVELKFLSNDGSTVAWQVEDGAFESKMPHDLRSQRKVIEQYLAYESDFAQGVINGITEEVANEDSPLRDLIAASRDTDGDHYAEVGYDTWSGTSTIVSTFNNDGDLTTHALFKREVQLDFAALNAGFANLLAEQVSEPDGEEDYE